MKHRNISFYLNTAFVVVLAAVIAFIGVAGVKFFHRWSVENVVDRLEVALVDAEGLLQSRRKYICAAIEGTMRAGDVDDLIERHDRDELDQFLESVGIVDGDTTYSLVVNADGTILSSRQEAVGRDWGLSYLLKPLSEGSGTILTTEILPQEYVARCSQRFQDCVHVPASDGIDVDYACLALVLVPVFDDDSGEFVGAVVGGFVINNNREFAESYTERVPNTYLSAGARDGTRICSNIAVDDFSFLEGTMQGEEFVAALDSGQRWRGVVRMADGREGVVAANPVYNYAGEVIGNLGVGAPVFTIPNLSGSSVALFLLILTAIFVSATTIMHAVTNIVVKPLAQLQLISKTIATEKVIPAGTAIEGLVVPTEIDNLAADIFSMAGEITHENTKLEQRVAERTLQLDNTIVELQAANRHKSQFLANISHELRTPLNSIIGFAALLKDRVPGPLNSTQERYTDVIIESGNHLLDMINDILKLVKMDAGADKPSPAPLNLPLLITTAATSVYPIINEHDQTLSVEIVSEETMPIVGWDEKMIRQVILNLLVNASKFTPEKGTITIRAASDGDAIALDVIDTGVGIEDDMKERVFLAFEQADNSYTRLYKGVGLGLAITKSIVEKHQGKVWLEDNPGGGTQVRMRIPVDPFEVLDESDRVIIADGRSDQ